MHTLNYEGSDSWDIYNIETDSDKGISISKYNFQNQDLIMSSFKKQDNKYKANIFNNTLPGENEVSFGDSISGIKGYYMSLRARTLETTRKELFAISSTYSINSN